MLLIEMLECRILVKDIHALTLAEHDPNRTVLEDQSSFTLKEYTHLLIQHQLDKQLCRLT